MLILKKIIRDKRWEKIIYSGSTAGLHKLISILTNLVSIPITINYLGEDLFGVWVILTSLLSFQVYADFGLGNGLINEVAKTKKIENDQHIIKTISSIFYFLTLVTLITSAIFFIFFKNVSYAEYFNIVEGTNELDNAVKAFTILLLINIPISLIAKIRTGLQESFYNNLAASVGSILSLMGVLIVIEFDGSIFLLVLYFMLGQLIPTLFNIYLLLNKRQYLIPKVESIDIKILKDMISNGIIFFLIQISAFVANAADNLIIVKYVDNSSVATYAVTKKIFLAVQVTNFFIAPLWPAFVDAINRNEIMWAKGYLKKFIIYSLLLSLIPSTLMLVFMTDIVSLVSEEISLPSNVMLIGFFFYVVLNNISGPLTMFMNNKELLKKQAALMLISTCIGVVMQTTFCIYYGAEFVIYGLFISIVIFYTIPALFITNNYLNRKQF